MSSATAPLQVDETLERNFKAANEGDSTRYIQVQIKDERLVQVDSKSQGNVESDYDSMATLAKDEEASYFLFKQQKEWVLITFVPDGVSVKDKMIYASAKGTLKDKLGHSYFVEEVHITSKDELNYAHYKGEQKPADPRSNFEIERDKVIEEENQERQDLAKELSKKEAQGLGGYHSVSIPLNASAKTALDRLNSGEVNFVTLVIQDDKSSITSTDAKKVESSRVSAEIHSSEPRFYVYTQFGKLPTFIYSCPGSSPAKLKMVYSTAKSHVISQITQYGVALASRNIEITDASDLDDELKNAQTVRSPKPITMTGRMIQPATGSTPALGGTVKASNLPTVNAQHAIYGLMQRPGVEGSSTKKKIVIPPRAAWNG